MAQTETSRNVGAFKELRSRSRVCIRDYETVRTDHGSYFAYPNNTAVVPPRKPFHPDAEHALRRVNPVTAGSLHARTRSIFVSLRQPVDMLKRSLLVLACLAGALPAQAGQYPDTKLDAALRARTHAGGTSRVIIETTDVNATDVLIRSVKGKAGRRLGLVRGQVAEVPNASLESLARHARVSAIRLDRPVRGTMERTSATIGAKWVRESLGSRRHWCRRRDYRFGRSSWHDDLGSERVVHFADFVDFQPTPHDDYGHGTHVAGIIAGSGYDSNGAPPGHRARRESRRAEGARRRGFRIHQQRHRGARLRGRASRAVQHSSHQPVGRGGCLRIVYDRSVDARRQARRRSRRRRRHGGGKSRAQRSGAAAVRRHYRSGKCALGADRWRIEPQRHHQPRG